MAEIMYLDERSFEIICSELETFFLKYKDPPPVYNQTYFDKLASIISTPQRTFDGHDLYKSVYEKAACYFYFINKLHPFNNGNKRIAITATGVFLLLNSIELIAKEELIYGFARSIILSHGSQDEEFARVVQFIQKHSKVYRW